MWDRRDIQEGYTTTAPSYNIPRAWRVGTRPVRYTTTALTDLPVLKVGCSHPFGEPAEHTGIPRMVYTQILRRVPHPKAR